MQVARVFLPCIRSLCYRQQHNQTLRVASLFNCSPKFRLNSQLLGTARWYSTNKSFMSGNIEIIFLGTASQAPSSTRNVSSYCMRFANGSIWMVDCGEGEVVISICSSIEVSDMWLPTPCAGTQHQFKKTKLKFKSLDTFLITHLHGDHMFGLPGEHRHSVVIAMVSPMHDTPPLRPPVYCLASNGQGG